MKALEFLKEQKNIKKGYKMISKELLSEVLGKDVSDVSIVMNNINYVIEDNETQEDDELVYIDLGMNINIYELANKCKEWAYNQNFYIYSIVSFAGEGWCYITKEDNIEKRLKTFIADTEPEAVFEACEWILSNYVVSIKGQK